jgi:hypothetical protein
MWVRDLGRILQPALIAVTAIGIVAPGISLASEEAAPIPDRGGNLGDSYRDSVPGDSASRRDARAYSSVLIGPLLLGFTEEFLANRDRHGRRVRGGDLERMERAYREAFGSNLATEYAISQVPGPGVVRADALLIDHVLDKRDWLAPGLTTFGSAPEVRMVVFLRDSRSDELVDTVGLTLPPRSGRLMKGGPGDYWNYMRLVFDRIATRVRWALEDGLPES